MQSLLDSESKPWHLGLLVLMGWVIYTVMSGRIIPTISGEGAGVSRARPLPTFLVFDGPTGYCHDSSGCVI